MISKEKFIDLKHISECSEAELSTPGFTFYHNRALHNSQTIAIENGEQPFEVYFNRVSHSGYDTFVTMRLQ